MPTQTLARSSTEKPLTGRIALITGSTSGIGLGIARALAGAGAAVVLNGFGQADDIAEAQAAIARDFAVPVSYAGADMANPAAIAGMIETTLDLHGRLDILVNNAGIQYVAPVIDFPAGKWDAILAINLSLGLPHDARWRCRPCGGRAAAASSTSPRRMGWSPRPFKSAYVAAKHGIVGLHQDRRAGGRRGADHLQRHLPRLRPDAAGRGADRRPGKAPTASPAKR